MPGSCWLRGAPGRSGTSPAAAYGGRRRGLLREGPLPGAPGGGDPEWPAAPRTAPSTSRRRGPRADEKGGGAARPSTERGRGRPSEWLEKGKGRKKGWRRREVVVTGRAIRLRHRVDGALPAKGAPERAVFLIVVKGVDLRAKSREEEGAGLLLPRERRAGGG